MAVVDPDERSAAAGVTGDRPDDRARPSRRRSRRVLVASAGAVAVPFFLAGGLKIVYDLLLYRDFRARPAARGAGARQRLRRGDAARPRLDDPEPDPGERRRRTSTARIAYSNRLRHAADRLPVRAELDAGEDEQGGQRQRPEEREDREPQRAASARRPPRTTRASG